MTMMVRRNLLKNLRLMTVLGVALVLVVGSFWREPLHAASVEDGGKNGVKLKASQANGVIVVVPELIETYKIPPETVFVPVLVALESGSGYVEQVKLNLRASNGSVEGKVKVDRELEPVSLGAPDVLKTLREEQRESLGHLVARSVGLVLKADVSALKLKEGERGKIEVCVEVIVEGVATTVSIETDYQALALPTRPGWYGGDGHLHTEWSPDPGDKPSIEARAEYAKANGFGFVIITDHEDGIDVYWPQYVMNCDWVQDKHDIPVLPGVEITTAGQHGDLLAYRMDPTKPRVPKNQQYEPQTLINLVNGHNVNEEGDPISYAIIAHPHSGWWWLDWDDWSVTGFRGIEVLSNQTTAKSETINKWFELLNAGLTSALAGEGFVVGIGGSDGHYTYQNPGDPGFTWVYTTSYSENNRDAIWEAIKSGKVSASGRKDLGYFTVNNAIQGSVLRASKGDVTLYFNLAQYPVTGRKCTKITVYDKNQTAVYTATNPTVSQIPWQTVPVSDGFYLVKFEFAKTDGSDKSETWANPIFVDVYPYGQ